MQLIEEKLQARGLEVEELGQRLAAAEALNAQLMAQVGEEADSLEASAERWGEGAAAGDTEDATVRALVLEPPDAEAAAEEQAGEQAPQPQLLPEQPEQQDAGGEAGTPVASRRPTSSPTTAPTPPLGSAVPASALCLSPTPAPQKLRKIIDEAGQLFGVSARVVTLPLRGRVPNCLCSCVSPAACCQACSLAPQPCEGAVLSPSHVLQYVEKGSVEDVRLLAALKVRVQPWRAAAAGYNTNAQCTMLTLLEARSMRPALVPSMPASCTPACDKSCVLLVSNRPAAARL